MGARLMFPDMPSMRHMPPSYCDPMVAPPLGVAPPALPADASELDQLVAKFLSAYTAGRDLLIRYRDPRFMWIRRPDGREVVWLKGDLLDLIHQSLKSEATPWSAARVWKSMLPLTVARLATPEEITPEVIAGKFLAFHSRDQLHYEGGQRIDTVCNQRERDHMRGIARRYCRMAFDAAGVDTCVTDPFVTAMLKAAAAQSRADASMKEAA